MRFAGVFRKLRMLGDLAEVLHRTMTFASGVPDGTFTVYHALVSEINPVILCLDSESTVIPYDHQKHSYVLSKTYVLVWVELGWDVP